MEISSTGTHIVVGETRNYLFGVKLGSVGVNFGFFGLQFGLKFGFIGFVRCKVWTLNNKIDK